MDTPRVSLFGTFQIRHGSHAVPGFDVCRVQELFCYLLLHHDRPLSRESVASVLWGECTTTQSRAYLRKALWQLRSALGVLPSGTGLLHVENDCIQLLSSPSLWLDVAVFEEAYSRVHGVPGEQLDCASVQALRQAVDLYHGNLLEGWYEEWCLLERERLHGIHLMMLEKLMAHAAAGHDYEIAIDYGERILRYDCAHEHTHRELMRLRNLAGDRTGALRQYERCLAALRDELGVEPAVQTTTLHRQIRAGDSNPESLASPRTPARQQPAATSLHGVLGRLQQLQIILVDAQHQVEREIQVVEAVLNHEVGAFD